MWFGKGIDTKGVARWVVPYVRVGVPIIITCPWVYNGGSGEAFLRVAKLVTNDFVIKSNAVQY